MARIAGRCVLAVGLTLIGWTVGRAQGAQRAADFRLEVVAPSGQTIIRCVSGCAVSVVPHVPPPPGMEPQTTLPPNQSVTATCEGASPTCLTLSINGWITK